MWLEISTAMCHWDPFGYVSCYSRHISGPTSTPAAVLQTVLTSSLGLKCSFWLGFLFSYLATPYVAVRVVFTKNEILIVQKKGLLFLAWHSCPCKQFSCHTPCTQWSSLRIQRRVVWWVMPFHGSLPLPAKHNKNPRILLTFYPFDIFPWPKGNCILF